MSISDTPISALTVIDFLIAVVIGWILISLWQRFIDNLAYNRLKLNKDSAYHSLIVAVTITTIFVLFIYNFNDIVGGLNEANRDGIEPVSGFSTVDAAAETVAQDSPFSVTVQGEDDESLLPNM